MIFAKRKEDIKKYEEEKKNMMLENKGENEAEDREGGGDGEGIVQLSYHKIVTLFVTCVYFWVRACCPPFLHIPGWGRPGMARQKIRV